MRRKKIIHRGDSRIDFSTRGESEYEMDFVPLGEWEIRPEWVKNKITRRSDHCEWDGSMPVRVLIIQFPFDIAIDLNEISATLVPTSAMKAAAKKRLKRERRER